MTTEERATSVPPCRRTRMAVERQQARTNRHHCPSPVPAGGLSSPRAPACPSARIGAFRPAAALCGLVPGARLGAASAPARDAGGGGGGGLGAADRKSVVWGKGVSVRVELGGRRTIKKKKD